MIGTLSFATLGSFFGFAEYQAVLIDSEGQSEVTGAEDNSDVKKFRIFVNYANELPTFQAFTTNNAIQTFSPPSTIGTPWRASAAYKRLNVVDYVSACQSPGRPATVWLNTN